MPQTFHRPRPRARVTLAAFACLAGLLAGCGTGNEASSTPDDSAASTSASAGTADQRYDAWESKFRSCLSGKGFELPKEAGKIDFGDRQDAYKVAEDTCLKQIGRPPTTSGDGRKMSDQEVQEANLKRVQCLRDHGYTVDDPKMGTTLVVPEGVTQEDLDACFKP